jgi:hypothetical protein
VTTPKQVRARLWNPPNAVPDRGIDLGGKYAKLARWERIMREVAEHFEFEAEEKPVAKERGRK